MSDNKYRDELVQIIKDMGQELINRAEEMVSEDAQFITDFNIMIAIPNPRDELPSITYSGSTFSKVYMDRITGKEKKDV
jgi:hypothetical protein